MSKLSSLLLNLEFAGHIKCIARKSICIKTVNTEITHKNYFITMYIDTHTHLFAEQFNNDIDEVITRATQAGVEKIYMPDIDHPLWC